MSSHGGLLSVRSKNLVKFCVVLSNICIWAWLYISSGSLQRWSSYVFRVLMLHFWWFLSKKTAQKSGVSVVSSGLEKIGKSLKIRKNGWLCEALPTFFGTWQMRHFLTNLFRKLYPCLNILNFHKPYISKTIYKFYHINDRQEYILLIQWKGMSTKFWQKTLKYKQLLLKND